MISARAAAWYSCASRCIRSTSSAALWRTSRAPCSASAAAPLGALAGLGLAGPGVLEEARGLALGGVTGAGGIRLGLGEHRLGELAHPGRLRLGLGEPVAALGRGAAQQGLHPVPVGARALGQLVVVRAGPGVGVGLGLGEDLADRALRPRQVRLRAGDDLVGLGLRVGEQRGGVGAGLVEQLLGGGARSRCRGPRSRRAGPRPRPRRRGGARWRTPASRGAAGRGRRRWSRAAGRARRRAPRAPGPTAPGARAPPGRAALIVLSCSTRARSSSCVGAGLGVGQAGLGLLLGQRDGLVAGLGGAGPQQRGLVGRVGEHDLDLGAGLLEAALGLLARRDARWPAAAPARGSPSWVSPRTRVASARASVTSRLASARSWSARFWARVSRDSASSTGLTGAARPASPVVASRVDPSDTRPMIADATECRGPSRSIRAPARVDCHAHTAAGGRGRPTHEGVPRVRTPVHVRVRHRGTPGQDLRPDLGLDPRRDARPGPPQPRRRRDDGDHRPGPRGRRGHHRGLRRDPEDRARHRAHDRLRQLDQGLRRRLLRRQRLDRPAEPGHRPGRRHRVREPHRRASTRSTSRAPATRA